MSEYDDLIEDAPRQGPKQRPGPNDPQPEGIAYVDEQGKPEEGAAESLPPLVTAADLLDGSDDALSSLPAEEPDADTPPDDAAPKYVVVRNAYGPGAHSVKLASGKPVGVWVREMNFTGDEVREVLTDMGMEQDLVDFFARNRDKGIEADRQLAAHPAVAAFATEEERRKAEKQQIQAAFVKAQKKEKA